MSRSPDDMDEIYQILTELESLAAERVANRDLQPKELAILESAIRDMELAVETENRERWARADEAFHEGLVQLSGNSRLNLVISTFNDQVRRARNLTLYIRPLPVKSNQDHRHLLDAIKLGDGKLARQIHQKHRLAAKDMMLDLLAKYGFHQV